MLLPIYAALGNGTYYSDTMTGDLVVPCNNNDDAALALQFEGQQFSLSWQDLMYVDFFRFFSRSHLKAFAVPIQVQRMRIIVTVGSKPHVSSVNPLVDVGWLVPC